MIVPGSSSQSLAAALADELDEPLAPVSYDRFPDGESIARVPDIGDRAIVVAALTSDRTHIELLQLQDAARGAGAEDVVTVLPYLGYARQDRRFRDGDPISARAVARAISTGTDRVLVVSPHEERVCDYFEPAARAIDAAGRLAAPLPDDLVDPLFLAPDAGAVDVAERVRHRYGRGDCEAFEKTRHSGREVDVAGEAVAADRDVVIVDDIVATGSTVSETVGLLVGDARRVLVTCVHPVFAGNARTRLARAGVDAVYATDTVERAESAVSVAPAIADVL
ncbi:ribose-phosphate pyrophosphokinase [Halobacteriales archaeon SW_7_68_16]|nr:MAG: ribose-phosphate pyrophosphokinase [Halobacteriales archaeon SW_7_68_16]